MTRRRSGASRRWAILASGLVALTFVGLGVADAAQLNVSGPGIYTGSQARCTNGPVAVTSGAAHSGTSYTSVSVTNLAAACTGKAIQVTVYNVSGTSIATGTGSAGTAPFEITTTAFTSTAVAGVALLVGTWGVPTTWTPPGPTGCTTSPIALTPGSPVGASGKYRAVTLSSVDAACVGGAVVVRLYNGSGTLLYTGSGTVPAGPSFTLPNGLHYTPSQVVSATIGLRIDTFPIPYTWTP